MSCQCLTSKGIQCSRRAEKNSEYCWQHQKCKRPILKSKPKKPKTIIEPVEAVEAAEAVADDEGEYEEYDSYLDNYLDYWQEEFGVDPNLEEWKQIRRKKYVDHYRKQKEREFEKKMQARIPDTTARKMQKKLREGILCKPCTNLNESESLALFSQDPLRVIRLRIVDNKGKQHCLCYDVVSLYNNLKMKYGTKDKDLSKWRDPTTNLKYSDHQIKRIKNIWSKTRPESGARAQLESQLALSKLF